MQYVVATSHAIASHLHPNQLIILESTTYPGTTDGEMRTILENTGMVAGTDFYLAFSPEREDPNNMAFSTATIPKVVGGVTPTCLEIALQLYTTIVSQVVPVSSTRAAEATKLLENIYRSVNIALVNELKMLFDRMDINIWEVIAAAKTKPFGFQAFYPGPGLGGHCIPIDPFYLTWKAREYEFSTRFIELAGEINTSMPQYVVQKVITVINQNCQKSIRGASILILGLSYKKDIDDPRESPSFRLIEILEDHGAHVDYNDPHIPISPPMRHYRVQKTSVPLTPETLQSYDCIVISTDHTAYNPEFIVNHAKWVVDSRYLIGRAGIISDRVINA